MPSGWLDWDWGNVPSWVGTVFTSTSLGLAAVTYARSSDDRRRQRAEAERSQAARVSMWWINPRRAQVRNSNDVAVTVQAAISVGGMWSATSDRLGLGPGDERGLLLPGERDGESAQVQLYLIDSYGREWIRRGDGTLTALSAAGVPAPAEPPPSQSPELRWAPL
jgi:hypothetical protein